MPLPNGAAIKAIRQAKGLTGKQLAFAAEVSHSHLVNMENPTRLKHASEKTLGLLAVALEVPVEAITVPEAIAPTRRRTAKVAA